MLAQLTACIFNFLLSFYLFQSSEILATTNTTNKNNYKNFKVYKPNWSLKEHKGNSKFYSLVPYKKIKNKKNKTPLILIHGVISEFKPYSNWEFLIEELSKKNNKSFFDEHPIYIYRYETSSNHWDESAKSLELGIKELLSEYPQNTKIKFVVSSLGGPVLCDSIGNNKRITDSTDKVISLSSPFWGTPLLNKNLSVSKQYKFGGLNSILFDSTDFLFPDLGKHIYWKLPISQEVSIDKEIKNHCKEVKPKTINYAGFISSPANQEKTTTQKMDKWVLDKIQSADYKKMWNIVMHYKLAWEIHGSLEKDIYLFNFNDGLVPIYSSLWLQPKTSFDTDEELTGEVLQKIKTLNPKARIFEDITHSEFTDIEHTHTKTYKDLLKAKSKDSIASFIIKDLQNNKK